MSQIRPLIELRYGRQNEPVRIPIQPLLVDSLAYTFIDVNSASGSSTLTVKNITSFAINQVLLIGEPGNQGSEIIFTHASTAPTGSTITLASNTVYPHSAGTPVRVINFDQVEISHSSTVGGSKSVLTTISLVANQETTDYNDTASTSGFYYARFYNSITTTFSSYSDPIPYSGYTQLTARSLIDNALGMINKETSQVLTDEYGFQQINSCQMEVLRELKRWSFLQIFDYSLGQVTTGQWKVAVPTDLDDQNTNKSIYNFKIGTLDNLMWIDKEKWNEIIEGVAHTTLSVAIAVNDTTVTVADASNFPDGGTLYIGSNTYGYSSVNRTTNVFTLNSASTTTNAINSDVFSGASLGTPTYWTTFGGYIYFYPVLSTELNQREATIDYYKSPVTIYNDSDLTVFPDPTVIQYYLAWKFLLKLQSGKSDATTDFWYNQFVTRREKLKQKEVLGRTFKLKPIINSLDESNDVDNRQIRTGNFPNTDF